MRTVITVSLNGTAYQLETAAHEQLDAYLHRAGQQLASNPDRAEILSDLEQAIADKCNRHLGAHKNVITTEEMAGILEEMGPVDGGADHATAADGSAAKNAGSSTEERTTTAGTGAPGTSESAGFSGPRPFYRIREGQVIAGVCTGIAAYLGWHVSVVRALVILFGIVAWGVPLLPYLIIAMLVPYAETPQQQADAHGKPFTADDVVRRARAQYEAFQQRGFGGDWKAQRRQFREQRRQWRAQQRLWKHQAKWGVPPGPFVPPPMPQPPFPSTILGAVFVPVLGLLSGLLGIGFVVALLLLVTRHTLPGLPLPGVPWWVVLIGLCMVYGLIVSPLHQARHAFYAPSYANAGAALFGTVIWLGLLVAGAWLVWQHWPQVLELLQQASHSLENLLAPPTSAPSSKI